MGAVASFVGDVVDTVGDVVETVGDVAEDVVQAAGDAVETVGDTVGSVVEGALQDPIGTMATVAAIATQQYYLLPAISAGKVVANGGDLDDALKAAAVTYVAGEVGGMAGDQVSAAANYGTELGSAQTAMLAAQDAGMGMGTLGGKLAGTVAGAGTGAALSGRDLDQSIMGALAGFGMNLGMNAAGQVINEAGEVVADSYDEFLASQNQTADQPGDFPLNAEELAAADTELGGLASINEGDQPGDYPLNSQELAAEDELLAGMNAPETYGDQPGDFPTTEEDLLLENELMGQVGDQPGDYDTTAEELSASEDVLAGMENAAPVEDFELDASGVKDYLKDQYKGAFLKNLLGAAGGVTTGTLGLSNFYNSLNRAQDIEDEKDRANAELESSSPVQNMDFSLFDPVGNATWAPQTKIGGLGAAGKYINQDRDTYYVNPEQAKKEEEARKFKFGWEAPDEYQEDPYYEYDDSVNGYEDVADSTYKFAEGGLAGHNPEFFSEGGMGNRYVKGRGDGTSDSVPAMLASGEFVIPADVVSGLGNGDNDAGAKVLDQFMMAIRKHKRSADPSKLPEDSKGPLSYLEEAMKKARK